MYGFEYVQLYGYQIANLNVFSRVYLYREYRGVQDINILQTYLTDTNSTSIRLSKISISSLVSRMDRVRNEEVCSRAGIESELASRDQRVLRWFGHVERMDVYRMARRVLMAEVGGGRVRGRPRPGWMDDVRWP